MITVSNGSPGGTHHISPKLRVSTKRSSWPSRFQNRTRVWRQGSWWLTIQRNWPVMRRCTPQWPASSPSRSSVAIRYLPRRCQAVTVQPSRALQNSSGSGGAAMARARSTSTWAIWKPTTWRSRPRRTVSTSGSSGTAVSRAQGWAGAWERRWQPVTARSPTCCQAGDQKLSPAGARGRIRPCRARSRRSCWC